MKGGRTSSLAVRSTPIYRFKKTKKQKTNPTVSALSALSQYSYVEIMHLHMQVCIAATLHTLYLQILACLGQHSNDIL